jgi:hypothetical protein
MQMVERASRGIVALPEVSTALSTVTFAPDLPENLPPWDVESSIIDRALNAARDRLVESGYFAQQPGSDLFRISLRIGAFADVDYSHFVEDIRQAVDPVVYAAVLETGSIRNSPATPLLGWEITRQVRDPASGAAEFNYVHHAENEDRPDELVTFTGLVRVAADGSVSASIDGREIYAAAADELPVRPTYTGIVPLVYKAQNELMRSLYTSYACAFLMIVAVMVPPLWKMVGALKSLPAALVIMLPSFYPTAVVFGTMGMLRAPLDVGTMMTASVALGIALDDTVHYLAWFDDGVKRHGMSRVQACRYAYSCCARPMVQTTIVACIGMSVFTLSTFAPTMQFGLFMAPLMAVALFGDLVILPALLASPLGWLFVRGGRREPRPLQPPVAGRGLRRREPASL